MKGGVQPPTTRNLVSLLTLVLAACGGHASAPNTGTPGMVGTPASGATLETVAAAGAGNKPLVASSQGDNLKGIGLDPNALPTLDQLSPEQLRKVMGTFTKSLGVDCKFCHKGADFAAPTEHKKIAERMWNEWVHGVKLKSGSAETPMYCDSCHQGRAEFLDKTSHEELAKWMKAEFVGRMDRGAEATSCKTCHGEPFDPAFLEKWGKL